MTATAVATGQRWKPKGDTISWMVVSLSEDGTIGLSGPGPCRGMKWVHDDEFFKLWELVSPEEPE